MFGPKQNARRGVYSMCTARICTGTGISRCKQTIFGATSLILTKYRS
jgi:hypothetical protein